ncbi:MAG TPA: prepilin-type N-terminal cleavage/methylation domain-containing protein [Candidatus Acidoferrum sp.]
MGTLRSLRKPQKQSGFTIIETMVAIVVLTIGLMGTAALMTQMLSDSGHSRYMSIASMLTSEKLEDLNRFPINDPAIAVPAGQTAGSLTADTSQSVTVGATTETVDYFDVVQLSSGNGGISETSSGKDATGSTVYTTITHQPDGTVVSTVNAALPPVAQDTVTFNRRWVIEIDQPVVGVRRISVLVTLKNPLLSQAVTFQNSMVRP